MPFRHARRAAPLALLWLAACHAGPAKPHADKAWVRLAAVPGRPAAGYVTLHAGAAPLRLLSIDADQAGSSELHASMRGADMASMKRLDGVDVPADGQVAFAPGGNHVMLFGMNPNAKAGDTIGFRLRFAKGPPITAPAKLVAAGDPAPY